jgi:transposase-like protein
MPNPVTPEERKRIVALLKESKSQNATAKEVGRDPRTVNRIAKAEGIESHIAAPKRANEARRDYAQAERLELLNEGFDKARELLDGIQDAREMQAWMVAVGTGIDKRRLESGEVTSRGEHHNHAHRYADREEHFDKLFAALDQERARADEPSSGGGQEVPVDTNGAGA